jgi:hypothetical protein
MGVHTRFDALILITGHRMGGHGDDRKAFDFGFVISDFGF